MTTTTDYTWGVAQMERHTADGIVFTVHYTVAANDGTYASSAYGSIGLEQPEGEVIPYADLTPEIVIGWAGGVVAGVALEWVPWAAERIAQQPRCRLASSPLKKSF